MKYRIYKSIRWIAERPGHKYDFPTWRSAMRFVETVLTGGRSGT